MRKMHIGKVIRQRREALGYTQQELCEGICEPPNISRIENGVQIPSRRTMTCLLERLGLSGDMYMAYLSDNEAEIEDLQTEIVSCNMTVDSEKGLAAIERLEQIVEENDHITRQFILRSKAILGHRIDDVIIPYTEEERLELLYSAIKLTVPKFEIDKISDNLYGIIEVKIINQIAQVYSRRGQNSLAIDIYQKLFEYVKTHMEGLKEQSSLLPMISYNYSRELCMQRKAKDAMYIAEIGREYSIRYGRYEFLGGLLVVIADCLCQLGNIEESQKRINDAFNFYKILEKHEEAKITLQHAREILGVELV